MYAIMEANSEADRRPSTIVTASGKVVDILNPKAEDIDIRDIACGLSKQCRYNGQIPYFYSVAEHSIRVSLTLRESGGPALAGLLHDASEAYIGDVVRPLKKIPEFEEVYGPIEKRFEDLISEVFGVDLDDIRIHDADMAVYHWEVVNVRTGFAYTMEYAQAYRAFLDSVAANSR